jgi:AcrR family transcriptional regulator
MATRKTRVEQAEYNREQVLAAALEVFEQKGYHAATVDEMAERAGYSKGVVYSQFGSKSDLFLALLERRVERRARENLEIAMSISGPDGLRDVAARAEQLLPGDRAWNLLVMEFRTYAARVPELNRRYMEIHERTVAGIARVVQLAFDRGGVTPPFPPEELARMVLGFTAGFVLEELASPAPLSFAPYRTALMAVIESASADAITPKEQLS